MHKVSVLKSGSGLVWIVILIESVAIHPLLKYFVKNDLLNSLSNIKRINVPMLICHGLKDKTISVDHAHLLFKEAGKPKKLILLECEHDDVFDCFNSEYYNALEEIFHTDGLLI